MSRSSSLPPIASLSSHKHHDSSKKKKKRKREDESRTAEEPANVDPALKPRKKKRRKKHNSTVGEIVAGVGTSSTNSHSEDVLQKDGVSSGIVVFDANEPIPERVPEPDSASQLMANALLSALVAASSGTVPQDDQATHPYHSSGFAADSISPDNLQNTSHSNLLLSDASSNDLVLRALQELDISKIANVLKSLEEAATAANVPFGVPPVLIPSMPTPVGQIPATSESILRSSDGSNEVEHRVAVAEGFTREDHAHMLATKWLSAGQLNQLARSQGLVYKKGKFSVIEEQQLSSAIEQYRLSKSLSEEQMYEVIFPKDEKSKDNAFWSEITAAVPQRPIIAVYHHIRRSHHPVKQQGKWTPAEDLMLKQAVANHGQSWEKVGLDVGRRGMDCRDRYRNHIQNRELRVNGQWSKEEEEELTKIVTDLTLKQGRDADNDVFWGVVSQRMCGKRSRQQCRIKWTDCLNPSTKNAGQKPRWGNQDSYILVHKLDSLQIFDDSEIDWKTIPDPQWNLWSPHILQRRWLTMKRGVKGHEFMTHQEIMEILKAKKVNAPVTGGTRKRVGRKVTSANAIAETETQSDMPVAGPSTSSKK
ncbi:hypothetical protein ARMSODRAFT_953124 [Armillaria solidipes]|uniref:DNA-binding protein REB1 n=1 Tax=Armillaria solidipes TaxID=1076256 RepID=A0A2H3CBR0_9AGAR|nr:hypothetical protein ARMSODRAFT_953124 [Armillaria solidipes]